MKRRSAAGFAILVAAFFVAGGIALLKPRRDLPIVAVLWIMDPSTTGPYLQHFKEGLHDLGWVDGRNVRIVERYDEGDAGRRPRLAAELLRLDPDSLYVSAPALPAARNATTRVPIICPDFYDPVLEGATTSLARPDRNVTGVSWQTVDSAGKRVQLIRELLPRARRVGMMFDATDVGGQIELHGVAAMAREVGITVEKLELRTPQDIEPALTRLKGGKLDALIVGANTLTWPAFERIESAATANRIPIVSEPEEFATEGAVVTYGPDMFALYRRSAIFVDRILKGATPKDLPIEQPTAFDLVVNLKAASTMGVAVPETVLERATKVIR
jgi:putative ABC transport system substrate-binding protein